MTELEKRAGNKEPWEGALKFKCAVVMGVLVVIRCVDVVRVQRKSEIEDDVSVVFGDEGGAAAVEMYPRIGGAEDKWGGWKIGATTTRSPDGLFG